MDNTIISWKWKGKSQSTRLKPGVIVVGRSRECDVRLDDSSVSRRHISLTQKDHVTLIEDLNSSAGTFVNGKRVMPNKPQVLLPQDTIKIGAVSGLFGPVEEFTPAPKLGKVTEELAVDERLSERFEEVIYQCMDHLEVSDSSLEMKSRIQQDLAVLGKEVKDRLREYRLIQEITEILSQIFNLRDLLNTALEMVADLLGADRGFILLKDRKSEQLTAYAELRFNATGAVPNFDWNFSRTIAESCFQEQNIIMLDDATQDKQFNSAQSIIATKIRSVVCLPLSKGDQSLGVLYLDHLSRMGLFHNSQTDFLRTFARQTTLALENAKLYTQAVTDDLTGLFNRKYSEGRIENEMQRANRYERTLSLLMIDIDHFKQVNDTQGHLMGDIVLKKVAEIIMDLTRKADLACRFGGEEFIVLLPETSPKGAKALAERIRTTVQATTFNADSATFRVTVSMGLAHYQKNWGIDPEQFIDAADKALYKAKESGRNKLVLS